MTDFSAAMTVQGLTTITVGPHSVVQGKFRYPLTSYAVAAPIAIPIMAKGGTSSSIEDVAITTRVDRNGHELWALTGVVDSGRSAVLKYVPPAKRYLATQRQQRHLDTEVAPTSSVACSELRSKKTMAPSSLPMPAAAAVTTTFNGLSTFSNAAVTDRMDWSATGSCTPAIFVGQGGHRCAGPRFLQ